MTDHLIETFQDGIATLTMNRPKARNAMSTEMMSALMEALPRLAADSKVRALVLTGAAGAFCAGGDVKGFARRNDEGAQTSQEFNHEQRLQALRMNMEVSRWLHEMPKPTLAAIPGAAAGAGFSLALACDLRIALDKAKITSAFSKIGLAGDYGGSYFLSQLVGTAKAREMYFLGSVISGQQAFELGIVNKAVSADEYNDNVQAYAEQLASLPTVAVGYMKKNLNAALKEPLSNVLDLEAIHMLRTFMTEDHKDAAKAFVEKRTPVFRGR